jgi:hypothetical protein
MSGGKIQSAVDAAISFVNALTASNGDKHDYKLEQEHQ